MNLLRKLSVFIKPYWRGAIIALVFLCSQGFLDLSIPRLIQRIIDQGIVRNNPDIVFHTAILMIGISILSVLIAIGNKDSEFIAGSRRQCNLRGRCPANQHRFER